MLSNKVRGSPPRWEFKSFWSPLWRTFRASKLKGAFWDQNLSKNFCFEKLIFDPKKPTLDIPPLKGICSGVWFKDIHVYV